MRTKRRTNQNKKKKKKKKIRIKHPSNQELQAVKSMAKLLEIYLVVVKEATERQNRQHSNNTNLIPKNNINSSLNNMCNPGPPGTHSHTNY